MKLDKVVHKPYILENKNSNSVVIFIHGILESPNQFKEFARIVENIGFSYSAVLLDGHGKSGKDFARSNRNKWIESVDKEILVHRENYENIILVGHSMGSLLSVLVSSKYKNKVKGMVLISSPLRVFVRINMMRSSVKVALGLVKEKDILATHAQNAFSVDRSSMLTYVSWIPRYKDLFSLIVSTTKVLQNIDIPTLIVQCKKDELVSYSSLKVFKNKLKNDYEIVSLEKSGHFYYDEGEFNHLLNEFKLFINKLDV